jgi:protein-disulfide isomerase
MILRLLYIAVFIVAAVSVYKTWAIQSAFSVIKSEEAGTYLGNKNAEHVLVEFVDYRCKLCRQAHPVMKQFIEKNPSVKVIVKHFPGHGEFSIKEIQIVLAAAKQGKFKEIHDELMLREEPVTESFVESVPDRLGIDREQFNKDLKDPKRGPEIIRLLKAFQRLNIMGVPSFTYGKTIYYPSNGVPTIEELEELVFNNQH